MCLVPGRWVGWTSWIWRSDSFTTCSEFFYFFVAPGIMSCAYLSSGILLVVISCCIIWFSFSVWGMKPACFYATIFFLNTFDACLFYFYLIIFLKEGFTLLPRQECSSTIVAHCSLDFLGSSDPPTSAPQVAGTIGMYHHMQLSFLKNNCVETGWSQTHYVAKADLKSLGSSDPPASASQSAGITGLGHCAWPAFLILQCKVVFAFCGTLIGISQRQEFRDLLYLYSVCI